MLLYSGCDCKEVYRFPLPTPVVSALFAALSVLFVHFKNVFVLVDLIKARQYNKPEHLFSQ